MNQIIEDEDKFIRVQERNKKRKYTANQSEKKLKKNSLVKRLSIAIEDKLDKIRLFKSIENLNPIQRAFL